jgi:peptide/nickel transport system ATP-binding protein
MSKINSGAMSGIDSGAMSDTILEVRDLAVRYEARGGFFRKPAVVRAVDGLSFDVRRGEVLAVVGESGCGKTTLGKAVTRLVDASAGSVLFDGQDLLKVEGAALRRMCGRFQTIFQDPYESLDPRQSIFDIVAEPLLIHKAARSEAELRARVYAALESAGLHPAEEIARRYPHLLSGGQRQRVSIAATMILEPELIVADEPVSMLDVSIRAEIIRLMLELRDKNRLTYIFITHDLSLAWMIADRVMVLYLGKMVEIGPADAIIHGALHPYTQALVSVIPVPEASARSGQILLQGETPSPIDIPPGCRFRPRCWKCLELGEPAICAAEEPAPLPNGSGHLVACHFAGLYRDNRR